MIDKRITDTTEGVLGTVYFAHPFDKWNTMQEEMIEKVLVDRGYDVVNPFKEEDRLNEKYGVEHYYQRPIRPFAEEILKKDYDMVRNCDSIFCWIPKGVTMIGTIVEMCWAKLMGKRITVLCYKPNPFLLAYADKLYLTYGDFVDDNQYEWQDE